MSTDRPQFCLSCKEPGPVWCVECSKELTPVCRWYLIGLYDAWDIREMTSISPEEAARRYAAYEMGCADRIGEQDESCRES